MTDNFLSILWSWLINLQISHQAPFGPRVNYICNKPGTWIVCTSLKGCVRIRIGLYNPIGIGIGLYNPIRIGIVLYNPIKIGIALYNPIRIVIA